MKSVKPSSLAIQRLKPLYAKVGLVGVGHRAYWDQFDGLLEQMHRKLDHLKQILLENEVEVISFGMSDAADTASVIAAEVNAADLDLLFIDMLTYATSGSIAAVFRNCNVPKVLVALQPDRAMEYEKASTHMQLRNDDICSIPEFINVAIRFHQPVPEMVIGTLQDDAVALSEIKTCCQIAKVLYSLKHARIGQMGHILEGMLDMHTDPAMLNAAFGCHVVQCEPDEVLQHYGKVTKTSVEQYREKIRAFFDFPDPGSDPITEKLTAEDMNTAARAGVALEQYIQQKKLDGLAYYYEGSSGSGMREMLTSFIAGNSLLTAAGFPMCGELDLKTCIAMLIMDRLEIGGSFAEFHPVDFREGFVLLGHDGPHHINIAEGRPVLRSLKKYHGKPGHGASVEFKIREGPITMLAIAQKADGKFRFILAEGRSVKGPIPATGNTNTRGFFEPDVRTFLKRWFAAGPTHHFALGIGHHAETIRKIGGFLNIETVVIPSA